MSLSALKSDLQIEILSYLAYPDLLRCARVCRLWNNLIKELPIWKKCAEDLKVTFAQIAANEKGFKWQEAFCNVKRIPFIKDSDEEVKHGGFIQMMAVSGCRLVLNREVKIEFSSKEETQVYNYGDKNASGPLHQGSISVLTIFQNTIYTESGNGIVKIWDATTFDLQQEFRAHKRSISKLKATENRLISQTRKPKIRLWNLTNLSRRIQEYKGDLMDTVGNEFAFFGCKEKSSVITIVDSLNGVEQNSFSLRKSRYDFKAITYFNEKMVFLENDSIIVSDINDHTNIIKYQINMATCLESSRSEELFSPSYEIKEELTSMHPIGDKLILGTNFGKIRVFDFETEKNHILYEPLTLSKRPGLMMTVSAHLIAFAYKDYSTVQVIELLPKRKENTGMLTTVFSDFSRWAGSWIKSIDRYMNKPLCG